MNDLPPRQGHRFATTRWSLVLAAGAEDPQARSRALEDLCTDYWFPLYAFARRNGADAHAAADDVQGFFADILGRDDLRRADPTRGRFRSFLLGAFRHFLSREREKARTFKRGGGRIPLSLDFDGGERRLSLEPFHERTPEREFDRRWALAVLASTLAAVRTEYDSSGRGALFEALLPWLEGASPAPTAAETAASLRISEGAVRSAVHRLRSRFRATLRAAVADTVAGESDVDAELTHLMEALASPSP
jgi:RNA polymerase sigma-70 factor (ECF subfamily)